MVEQAIKIYGHRGCRGKKNVAENSLGAFEVALKKADGIELDVFLTADKQVVVFHDETLEKLTNGTGNVTECTLAQLQQLSLRLYSGSDIFTHNKIPTLNEVLDLIQTYRAAVPKDKRIKEFKVCVEIKGAGITEEIVKIIERRIARKELNWNIAHFEVRSFDMDCLHEIKQRLPQLQLGVLFAGAERPWHVDEAELAAKLAANQSLFDESAKPQPNNTVSITLGSLTEGAVAIINRFVTPTDDGKPRVTPWTAGEINPIMLTAADQEALLRKLESIGKGGAFITDFPAEVKALIKQSMEVDA